MKAVTMNQPWATLLATGASRYSVRTWRTHHRGPLAIRAGHRFTEESIDLCLHEEVQPLLSRAGYDYIIELPLHALLGTVRLVDCVRIGATDPGAFDPADPACLFGAFYPENWAWVLSDARPLARPVRCRGRLGLFTIPDKLLRGHRP